eukprot:498801-Pyramimonas_sp.AAC.1
MWTLYQRLSRARQRGAPWTLTVASRTLGATPLDAIRAIRCGRPAPFCARQRGAGWTLRGALRTLRAT